MNAAVDISVLRNHYEHIHNGRQPIEAICSMSNDWFAKEFLSPYEKAAQFIYDLDLGFDLRRALPYAGINAFFQPYKNSTNI